MRRDMIEEDGRIIDVATEDMATLRSVADTCQHLSNEGFTGTKDERVLAHVPDIVIEKWCTDHGVTFAELMGSHALTKRMLEDPDLAAFRVWKGRV